MTSSIDLHTFIAPREKLTPHTNILIHPAEDPVLWKGRRGYHALFHQNLTHAWSESGVSDWHWSNEATAITELRRADGTTVVRNDHERPRVSLTKDGDLAAVFVASAAHQTATSDDAQLLVYETRSGDGSDNAIGSL